MAITLQCPRCTHEQKIDDDKAGKDVPCKICHHLIKTTSGAALASKSETPSDMGIKAGPATMPTSKKPQKPEDEEKGKKSEARRPVPRRRNDDVGSSSVLAVLLMGGGALLLLALICGGGLGAFWIFRPGPKVEQPIARNDHPNPRDNQPRPGPEPGPEPLPGPVQPPIQLGFPQQPVALDANNPKDMDRVLVMLKGPPNDQVAALAWLNAANTNHPRRIEVARVLDGLVDNQLGNVFGNDNFYNPYFRWATKDSIPALIRIIECNHHFAYERYRRECIRIVANFKDSRGFEPIAKRLVGSESMQATEALIEIGPIAQDVVLKYLNHSDLHARNSARKILQDYKTSNDVLITACLVDLDAPDNNRRAAALQWISKAPVEEKRRTEVSKALNKSLNHRDCLRNNDLVAALENWGTVENASKLADILDTSTFGNVPAIRLLGKIRDPQSMKIVAKSLANRFSGQESKKVLKEYGPAAEPLVIEAMNSAKDHFQRADYIRFLGEIGTKAVSVPALMQLVQRNPQDRFLIGQADAAVRAINQRGK